MAKPRTEHDGIIFDLDGTLWDSTAQCAQAWNDVLRRLKVSDKVITTRDIEKIMGMTLEQCFATSFPEKDEATRKLLAKECFEREIEIISEVGAALYPGVRAGLQKLEKAYNLYLVSNCSVPYLQTFFDVTGLRDHFRDSECHGGTGLQKSENIALVVERNNLKKAVYIGDTSSDQSSAKSAGVFFCHAAYGFGGMLAPCLSFGSFAELTGHFVEG